MPDSVAGDQAADSAPALRTLFAGTPEFAAAMLACLLDSPFAPLAVWTQPDRPSGRRQKLTPSPVKQLAERHRLPVLQPARLRDPTDQQVLAQWQPDVLVVAAYGLLLPGEVLSIPRLGCINVHASLLPRWRGAAPIERALMAGDTATGVCIMHMDAGLDTGDVYNSQAFEIPPRATAGELEARMIAIAAPALIRTLASLAANPELVIRTPQSDTGATYARKITDRDRTVDWSKDSRSIDRQIRALTDRGPAYTVFAEEACDPRENPREKLPPVRMQILAAEPCEPAESDTRAPGVVVGADKRGVRIMCGEGALRVTRLRLNRGKGKEMDAASAINGFSDLFVPGRRLDSAS